MSELGLKEGQGQDEKTPFFDSSKISDKKATEHFANVEGAAERAKQAERARIAAEKEAREVHAADIRAASEQMKKTQKAEKTPNKASGVFAGNHKWLFIIILLVAILATVGIVYYFASTSKTKEEQVEEKQKTKKNSQFLILKLTVLNLKLLLIHLRYNTWDRCGNTAKDKDGNTITYTFSCNLFT